MLLMKLQLAWEFNTTWKMRKRGEKGGERERERERERVEIKPCTYKERFRN